MSKEMDGEGFEAGVFGAFKKRWFRLFWSGRSLSTAGFRIQGVARDWLTYSLTRSSLWVSIVFSSWSLGTLLFSLVGGAMADRLDKRRLLVVGQAGCGVVMLGVAGLIFADAIRVWHLVVSTFALAALFSFVIPSRQAVVGDLTPDGLLMNALALSTVGIGLMGILSASLGGLLIDRLSPASTFLVAALLFSVTAWIYGRLPPVSQGLGSGTPIRNVLTEGWQYILERPKLLALFGLELIRVLFFQYTIFLPLTADEVYGVGGLGLGLLRGARGVGSVVGSLFTAWRSEDGDRYVLIIASGIAGGLGLILFGQASSFVLALASLSLVAVGEYVYMITRSTLLQSVQDERMRGRMVGFRRLMWGLRPVGGLPAGAIADRIGPSSTATLEGGIIVALFAAAAVLLRWLRRR